jgi:hypothetical protein
LTRLITRPWAALDQQQFTAARTIYSDAFPAHLRVPFEELAGTGPHDQLHVALDGAVPVGFAAVKRLEPAGWVFLRYFAISAERRRQRLGQVLWTLMSEAIMRDGWPARICLEVEDPAHAGDDPRERMVREGRVAFWASCGTVPLPVPGYVMPAITSQGAPEPMLLLAPAPLAAAVSRDQLGELITAIYTQRYGLPAQDQLIRQALASISGKRS